mgnify:CR=1 FL=1
MTLDEYLEDFHLYTLSVTAYWKKHNGLTHIGKNGIGDWYEHPIHGEEAGLLLVPEGTDELYLTDHYDIPSIEEVFGGRPKYNPSKYNPSKYNHRYL